MRTHRDRRPSAPIDAEAVGLALAPLGHSRTLPAAAYTDAAIAAWEREHLFEGGWTCIGRAADVAQPGDQRAVQVGRTGVLVARDRAGQVHVLANTCRHRGHELLACGDSTRRGVVQCPYHAWTYELDGTLRLAPRFDGVANFEPAALGLLPLRHAEWGGWLFVNVSGDAPELADHLGGLAGILAPYGLEGLVPAATHRYELAADWKLVHENYQECYHCPLIHPELCQVTVATSGQNFAPDDGAWIGGTLTLVDGAETMSFDGRSGGRPLPGLTDEQRRTVLYLGLFPNLVVSAHPDFVMTHRLEPLGPGRVLVECQWLFTPEVVAAPGFDPSYAVDFWDLVNRQDWAAIESVQRAMASPAFVPGLLARHEDAVHQFVAMVARGYLGLPLAAGPPAR